MFLSILVITVFKFCVERNPIVGELSDNLIVFGVRGS